MENEKGGFKLVLIYFLSILLTYSERLIKTPGEAILIEMLVFSWYLSYYVLFCHLPII